MPLAIAIIAGTIIALYVVALIIATFPVWIGAIICMWFTLLVYVRYTINAWTAGKKPIDVLTVNFTGDRLEWHVEEEKLKAACSAGAMLATVVGLIVAIAAFVIMSRFYQYHVLTNEDPIVRMGVYPIVGIIVVSAGFYSPRLFKTNFMGSLQEMGARANWSLSKLSELHLLENDISSLATQLNAQFPLDFRSDLQIYADSNKARLLVDAKDIEDLVDKTIAHARDDRANLQKTVDLYETAKQMLASLTRKIIRGGRPSLIRLTDEYATVLDSDKFKALITAKQWGDVEEVLNGLTADLKNLESMDIEGMLDEVFQENEAEDSTIDEEIAHRILNVPTGAAEKQITHMYRSLSQLWSPDKGLATDHKKLQAINRAYDLLVRNKKKGQDDYSE